MTDSIDSHTVQQVQDMLLRTAKESIFIIDATMIVRWVNGSALRMSRKSIDEIIDRDYRKIGLIAFRSETVHEGVLEAVRTGVQVYREICLGPVSSRFLKIIPSASGGVALILESPDDWQHVYDAIDHPSMILDSEQQIIGFNAAANELFGDLPADRVYGRHCYDLFRDCELLVTQCSEESFSELDAILLDSEIELKGHVYKVSCTKIDNGSAIQKTLYLATDVTAKRTAEDAASLYLDVIAHDIANHLQIILFGVSSMVDDMTNQTLQLVLHSINRITRLIAKARAIEGLESSQLEPMVLQKTLGPMLAEFQSCNPHVEFVISFPEKDCIVLANSFLPELIINLLDNAVRYNTKDEKIVWVRIAQVQHGWEVSISDNGVGIDSSQKESLLDGARRFGGIGIHQAKLISRRFGASLTIRDRVDSCPEEGAEFVVWFPKAK
ncbi:MAG: PAS domain-containing protein [Candidatus Thorarchaeota archaeon]|nr:PAS domain-containing protein [Candidatus Thorarchaeota archaeon]